MSIEYFSDELIDILKKRDYSQFWFHDLGNGYRFAHCFLYANDKADDVEVHVTAHDNTISEEMTDRVIDVLEHLDECIQRAYVWLSKQNLRDEWFTKPYYSPQELAQLFTVDVLDFREAGSEPGSPNPTGGAFVMSFFMDYTTLPPGSYYPHKYDVWFHYDNLQPYKSEKGIW